MKPRLLRDVLAVLLILMLSSAPAVAAEDNTPQPPSPRIETSTIGDDGGFGGDATETLPAATSSASTGEGGSAGPVSTVITQTQLVPTCIGNTSTNGADALCIAATTICPEPGEIRMWVFRRTVDTSVSPQTWPGFTLADPPIRCVGPQEQVVDPAVVIAGMIRREFESRAVLRGVGETSPAPRTLVNVATRLRTPTVERYPIEFSLLGQRVVIQVQAVRWTWVTGDGARRSTSAAGTMGQVEYVYRRAGVHRPYVEIAWRGTWSLNGRDMGAVPGTVTTRGEPVTVEVREARTQLVDG